MSYTATFSDGKTYTDSTERVCGFALRVVHPDGRESVTFSKSHASALGLSSQYTTKISVPNLDKSKAANAARKENAEYRASCKVEIATAEVAP